MPWIADGSKKYRCCLCAKTYPTKEEAEACERRNAQHLDDYSPYHIQLCLRMNFKNPCDFCEKFIDGKCSLEDKNMYLCLMTAYKLFEPTKYKISKEFQK